MWFENITAYIECQIPYSWSPDIAQREFHRYAHINIELTTDGVLTGIRLTDSPTGLAAIESTWYVHDFSPSMLREDNLQYVNDESSAMLQGLKSINGQPVKRLTEKVSLVSELSIDEHGIGNNYDFLYHKYTVAEHELEKARAAFAEFPTTRRETALNASIDRFNKIWKRCVTHWHDASKTYPRR